MSSVQDLVIEEPKYQRELKQFVSTNLFKTLIDKGSFGYYKFL